MNNKNHLRAGDCCFSLCRVALAVLAVLSGAVGALAEPTVPSGFVLIPDGSFQMGDALRDGNSDELPVHTVNVGAFFMEKSLVTKAQWDEVYKWAWAHGYTFDGGGEGTTSTHPVQGVDWFDAVKWCNARSEKEGLTPSYTVSGSVYRTREIDSVECNFGVNGYRLPTEAEWEKAARGGLIGKRFPWGDTIMHTQASYSSNSHYSYDVSSTSGVDLTDNKGEVLPVGSYAANGYGLYDMAGNVREWCWDWYSFNHYGSEPVDNPTGPASGSGRILRGGGSIFNAYYCRVSYRTYNLPDHGLDYGFRCVRK